MKSGITVAEAKRCKKYLEDLILTQIKMFQAETGCFVKSIDFQCNQSIATGESEIRALSVECGL